MRSDSGRTVFTWASYRPVVADQEGVVSHRIPRLLAVAVAVVASVLGSACTAPPTDAIGRAVCLPGVVLEPGATTLVSVNGQPAADRAAVRAGDRVEVEVAWESAGFDGPPVAVAGCVYTDREQGHRTGRGRNRVDLSAAAAPVPDADVVAGRWRTGFVVPGGLEGRLLCDRGLVMGRASGGSWVVQGGDETCLRVVAGPPPAVPEFPLPVVAVLVAGLGALGLVVVGRRRATG